MEKETTQAPESAPETPPQTATVHIVTPEELALPLAENMPEPTPGAVKEASPPTAPESHALPAPQTTSELRDRVGNVFSHEKYKANEDGSPRYSSDNCFIPKNKGRPPKNSNASQGQPEIKSKMPGGSPVFATTAQENSSVNDAAKGPDQYDYAAEAYFQAGVQAAKSIISKEWEPGYVWDEEKKVGKIVNADEDKKLVTVPLALFLRARQSADLTPGWALVLGAATYGGRRATMPETAEKIESGFDRVKKWFGFGKK